MINNDLIDVIKSLSEPGCLDYIQMIFTVVGVIISAVALIFAIRIPRKIAYEQNKIALFEKRFQAYFAFQRLESFSNQLSRVNGIDAYRKMFNYCFYEKDDNVFNGVEALLMLQKHIIPLQHMLFLFEGVSGKELSQMVESLCDLVEALEKNRDIELHKNRYISIVQSFGNRYGNLMCKDMQIEIKK